MNAACSVGQCGQVFPCFHIAQSGAVGVRIVLHGQIRNDAFQPIGDYFTLCHGVPNVFQGDFHAHAAQLFNQLHDLSNFIGQFACADVNDVGSHK